jgi:2'-5' RNA ligase
MASWPDPSQVNAVPPRERHRLFFALWPDATVRRQIADATTGLAKEQDGRGRHLRADRYHLTLQFLGDFAAVPESLVDAAIVAAGDVRVDAFELTLDRAGSFGGARVGWIGPARVPSGLQALWDELALALDRHDVPHPSTAGQAWTPHVTVLRSMRRPIALAIAPLTWTVRGFVLIRSQPGHAGYVVLQHWKLGR